MTRSGDWSMERCFDLEQQCYPTRRGPAMRRSKEGKPNSEKRKKMKVLDPRGPFLQLWNRFFALSCIAVLSLDPLFFYIPAADSSRKCLGLDNKLKIVVCVLRSLADLCYMFHMLLQFGTGYSALSSQEEGTLIEDLSAIAKRYVFSYFIVDIFSALPLPQVVILIIAPRVHALVARRLLMIAIFAQYLPRLFLICSLYKQKTRDSRIFPDTPWAGAAFNLFLYMLASNIIGAFWYLFTIERVDTCWRKFCTVHGCDYETLYCGAPHKGLNSLVNSCLFVEPNEMKTQPADFNFGIFLEALQADVVEKKFIWGFCQKYFYCFWWGLRNLSSMGQNLSTSNFVWENLFAIFISVSGLILFALLIGNMQKYLQSISARLGEMKAKRRNRRKIDRWMSRRKLSESLRHRIRFHEEFNWQGTRGIQEDDDLMKNLPMELRRDVNRHNCWELLHRVPMFENMDDRLMDNLCGRLIPAPYTEGSYIYREGDPIDEMLFLVSGNLWSFSINGDSSHLKVGDFCGEELLTWALDPNPCSILPISTTTVRAAKDVEAFALKAEDLRLFVSHWSLHSKQVQHIIRYYSKRGRTWAALSIQGAWHRYIRRKRERSLRGGEDRLQAILAGESSTSLSVTA